jgi:rubredoxin
MPKYIEDEQELIFTDEESEENRCPVCGKHLDYDEATLHEAGVDYPWTCPECKTAGKERGVVSFDGHTVDVSTIPLDMRIRYTGTETMCINRILKPGDLALLTPDNGVLPCLPGRIKAIDILGSAAHTSGNRTDDVHMDFTGDYNERRKREIIAMDASLRGLEVSFDEICLDDVIIAPSHLIGISEIEEAELLRVMDNEEDALRYAYRSLRMLI